VQDQGTICFDCYSKRSITSQFSKINKTLN